MALLRPSRTLPRPPRDLQGAMLTVAAFGLWLVMVGLYAIGTADRAAEAEDPDQPAWSALRD